jgi:hypothetical protein
MILILSNKWDITADYVVKILQSRNYPFLRINTEDLIARNCSITYSPFRITIDGLNISESVKVIWNRRPGKPYDFTPKEHRPPESTVKYVNNQWYSWLEGLQLIKNIIWINHPASNDAMESKARQLYRAEEIGFLIPSTAISNSPTLVKSHIGRFDSIVTKALFAPLIEESDQDYFIFTNHIDNIPNDVDDEISIAPAIYQEPLYPKIDYRVTVISDIVLSVRIEYEKTEPSIIDWRRIKDNINFSLEKLPPKIENMCREYVMNNGLIFGAIDLIKHNDKYYFIEINPNGEWGWLQKPHNIPIAETLSDYMVGCNND